MSGSIGATGLGYSLLNTLIANSTTVHKQLDTLTEQASSGLVAQTYAGLGAGAGVSLNLTPQLASLQTEQNNISQATGTMQVTQTAMSQIQQIAATFVANMPKLSEITPTEIDTVAASARQALTQVANLLDTKQGSNYVFGGQDSTNPPVPNPDSILSLSAPPGFYAQINAAVSQLSTNGATATAASTLAIASSNAPGTSPFSTYMSQSPSAPVVQTGEGDTIQIGLLASTNSAVASSVPTTGSYMRDLMRALATIGSMSSSQASDSTNFTALVQDTTTSLNGVVSAMATDVGVLGNNQTALTSIQSSLNDTATALKTQISAVQDVDMAATLTNLTATQTQLQASYRLISGANSLSLVNFLPTSG